MQWWRPAVVTVRACVGLPRVRAVSIRSCKACPGRWGYAGLLVAVVRLVRCSARIRACDLWFGCVAPIVRASLPWLQVGHSDRVLDHGLVRGGGGSCGVVCVGAGRPCLSCRLAISVSGPGSLGQRALRVRGEDL